MIVLRLQLHVFSHSQFPIIDVTLSVPGRLAVRPHHNELPADGAGVRCHVVWTDGGTSVATKTHDDLHGPVRSYVQLSSHVIDY